MPSCYVLYSPSRDHYYVGFTTVAVESRRKRHNENYYKNKFTSGAEDWVIYLEIECGDERHARNIEAHIKKMKSRKYIENLARYPEMRTKLVRRFKDSKSEPR